MTTRRTLLKAGALIGAGSIARSSLAQGNGKPVKLVTGFLPGGLTDVLARHLAEGLNRLGLGSNVIVDPHPGASGRISASFVKNSAPDGTTFLVTPGNVMTLAPHLYKKIDYDPFADFVPVHSVFSFAYALSVGPAAPASIKTLKDYLAWVKANPEKGTYAGVPGAPQHLLAAYLSKVTDTPLSLVAYKGGGPSMVMDILRGEAPGVIQVTADALQFQGPDKLRTLATFTKSRTPFLPEVPTCGEAGVPGLEIDEWGGVFAPKGTPAAIVQRWSAAIRQVVSQPAFKTALAPLAATPSVADGPQMARAMKEDHAFWEKVISTTGITLE